jgi:glyoxylase-like metal-dependent hydrolase (beta-lactamase superfamily II)
MVGAPPFLARVLPPAGPAVPRLVVRGGARVMAVPGRYSVTYLLLGRSEVAIVDVGSAADAPRILASLAALDVPRRAVRCVVPSHLHFDHAMGIDALARALGVPVALGPVAWEHVARGWPLRFPRGRHLARNLLTWPLPGLPSLAREDWRHGLGFGFPWSRDAFRADLVALDPEGGLPGLPGWSVLPTPGHADDAIALFHEDGGVLVAGDTIRNFYGGEWNPVQVDAAAFRRTQALLTSLPVATACPGHGPVLEGTGRLARLKTPRWRP